MYASHYVFGKGFFVAWLVISIIWVWGTMFIAGFFPIIDGWGQLKQVYFGIRGQNLAQGKLEVVQDPSTESSSLNNSGEDRKTSRVFN